MNHQTSGCRAIVLAPTRELVQQIFVATQGLVKSIPSITGVPIYGGASKMEQFKRLRSSCLNGNVIVIATPGRLIDMIKMKALYMDQVTMIILDEADRMLQMGFDDQVKCICQRVRPDRQSK